MPRKKSNAAGESAAKAIVGRRDTRRGRFYDITNGEAYPSVTTVLGVLAKPALIGWAAKMERSAVLSAAGALFEELQNRAGDDKDALEAFVGMPRDEFQRQIEEHLGAAKAHTKKLREAADIGTQVHKRIEFDILEQLGKTEGEEAPALTHPKAEESWRKYLAWKASVRMTPLASERAIVSHVHKYAGTEDLLVRLWPSYDDPIWSVVLKPEDFETNGLVVTGDFKTGKAVYGEMFLQNGAYRLAEKEMGYEPESKAGIIIRLPKEADDPGFEVVAVPPLEETIPGFLALRAAFNWYRKDEERYERMRAAKRAAEEAAMKEGIGDPEGLSSAA